MSELVSLSCDEDQDFYCAVTRHGQEYCLYTGRLTDLELEECYPQSMAAATFEVDGYLDLTSGKKQPRYTDQGPGTGYAKYGDEALWSLDPSGYTCSFDGLGNLVLTSSRPAEPTTASAGYSWYDPRNWLLGKR